MARGKNDAYEVFFLYNYGKKCLQCFYTFEFRLWKFPLLEIEGYFIEKNSSPLSSKSTRIRKD